MVRLFFQKSYKTLSIFLILLFGLIFSLSFFLKSSSLQQIQLGLTSFSKSVKTETNIPFAVNELLKNSEVYIEVGQNICYWIRPSFNETGDYLDIQEYDTKYGECVGSVKSKTSIPIDEKIVMYSPGCVCNGKYLLERLPRTEIKPEGLKISKV